MRPVGRLWPSEDDDDDLVQQLPGTQQIPSQPLVQHQPAAWPGAAKKIEKLVQSLARGCIENGKVIAKQLQKGKVNAKQLQKKSE